MKKSSIRTLHCIEIQETEQEICITYTGDGFLYNMVRILTGTLIEVGRGVRKSETMTALLESCDRKNAGSYSPGKRADSAGSTVLKHVYKGGTRTWKTKETGKWSRR